MGLPVLRRNGQSRATLLRRAMPVGSTDTERPRRFTRAVGSPRVMSLRSNAAQKIGVRPLSLFGVRRDKLKSSRVRQKQRPEAESTLEARGLRFGGVSGPIATTQSTVGDWHLVLTDSHRRSFVSYFKCAFERPILQKWWQLLHDKIRWDRPMVGEKRLPRSAAWLTLGDCTCTYKYGRTSWPALSMEPWFLEITDAVCHACGLQERPNSCNANLYEDGSQSVGWHTDDEPLFDATRQDVLIVSLSLGASRCFELRPDDALGDVTAIQLDDGDICTMEGLLQKHYKHRVGAESRVSRPRINLTWRWVVAHDASCPLHCRKSSVVAPAGKPLHRRDKMDVKSVRTCVQRTEVIDEDGPAHLSAPLVELTPEEKAKRARRAQRFGLPVSAEFLEKKDAPAARTAQPAADIAAEISKKINLSDDEEKRKRRAERFALPVEPATKARKTSLGEPAVHRIVSLTARNGSTANDSEDQRKLRSERFSSSAEVLDRRTSSPSAAKAPSNIAAASDSEKASKRAERFAEPNTAKSGNGEVRPMGSTESEKLKKRMERFADAKTTGSSSTAAPLLIAAPLLPKSANEEEEERRKMRAQRFQVDAQPAPKDKVVLALPAAGMSEEEKRKLRAKKFACS